MGSYEVQLRLHVLHDLLAVEGLPCEFGQLLGVLQGPGDLDGASPVHVIETLAEDEFLQDSFLHLRIAEDHLVVIGHRAASVRELRHQVEVVEGAHDGLRDKGPSLRVRHSTGIVGKEPLASPGVDHNQGDAGGHAGLEVAPESVEVVVDKDLALVVGATVVEDDDFLGRGILLGALVDAFD